MTRIEKNHFCSIKHVSVINTILASILLFNINGDLWVKPVKPGATNGLKLDNLDREHVRSGKAPFGFKKKRPLAAKKTPLQKRVSLDGITLFTLLQEQP